MIYYISYYVDPKGASSRIHSAAATGKVDYVARTLDKLGESVEIISLAVAAGASKSAGEHYTLSYGINYKSFFSLGRGGKLKKYLNYLWIAWQLFFYLHKSVKKGDIIIVYHSPTTRWLSRLLCKYRSKCKHVGFLRKVHVVLEVEEVYADVLGGNRDKEIRGLYGADGYIFPTKLLANELSISNAPFLICHGDYRVNTQENNISRFTDGKIHCVYAGTLQKGKGAFIAADAAQYLTEDYHVHILGYGSEEDVAAIKSHVKVIQKNSKADISYDGFLTGEEFSCFLMSCSIGLVTQNINASYNKTSFPSKTLVYLAHGLVVVSADFDAIKNSEVGEAIVLYSHQSPKAVAEAIQSIDTKDKFDGIALLQRMDVNFQSDMKGFLLQVESKPA